jgi:hypothetical protein
VAGLAAVLLGVCLIHADGDGGGGTSSITSGAFAPTAATVLDVLMSRVGLSQYVTRLEDMRGCELFQRALAAPRLPAAVTRAAVAAAGARCGAPGGGGGGDGALGACCCLAPALMSAWRPRASA